MLESKIKEEAKQKSKVFLREVMGDNTFDEFVKNGKVEIKSGNTTYELYESGNVTNITTNQKYCIVPDRLDYPSYDVIAIKFAWLKYGQETVDKVANKTSLDLDRHNNDIFQRRQRNVPTYSEFVDYMESSGWAREQVTIDERNTRMVATHSIGRGSTGPVIDIRCPACDIITFTGINQLPVCNNMDNRSAYTVMLRISDENDIEINGDTSIRIEKIRPSGSILQLVRGTYSLFSLTRQIGNETCGIRAYKTDSEWYRWRSGIQLMGNDLLRINVRESPIDIARKNIKMSMEMDLWVRY
jgi:hypothetical protein